MCGSPDHAHCPQVLILNYIWQRLSAEQFFPLAHKAGLEEASDTVRAPGPAEVKIYHKVGYFPTEGPVGLGVMEVGSGDLKCNFLFES